MCVCVCVAGGQRSASCVKTTLLSRGRINSVVEVEGGQGACWKVACLVPPYSTWQSWMGPWAGEEGAGHTSCQLSLEVVVEAVGGHLEAAGAGPRVEAAPGTGFPWAEVAGLQRPQAAGAAAMEAGFQSRGWTWWWWCLQGDKDPLVC